MPGNNANAFKSFFENKKILIWGFGREGKSTFSLIRRLFPDMPLWIADSSEISTYGLGKTEFIRADKNNGNIPFGDFDLIMKSPGIAVDRSAVPVEKLCSQTQLFLTLFGSQVIGVTGTKGKSTTSSLIYHIVSSVKKDTIFVGNIGIPCFDLIDKITPETTIVFELSCHQLEFATVSPRISVVLNLHEDHLDHYGTYEKYIEAKTHIFTYQSDDGHIIINSADKDTLAPFAGKGALCCVYQDAAGACADDIRIEGRTISVPSRSITIHEYDTSLIGRHNLYNIGVVYYICCELLGISDEAFISALSTFMPLPHRLFKVGEYDGVTFYDDSISTICESAVSAIKSLGNIGTIILGGKDRGIDYTELIDCLFSVKIDNIVLIGETSRRMKLLMSQRTEQTGISQNIYCSSDMADAVSFAKKNTPKGKICLLSPAAASYDMFKNFEERGDAFIKCVKTSA